jgi:eukaryotic-like serine/threonine-protein kinase
MGGPPRASELLPETLFADRYRIVRKLGEGAMGGVYLAEHTRMGRLDAIKVLNASLETDREAIARFERGARNVSAIRHPNVCTIYDFSTTADGVNFLAMEYVDGPTLKEVLDREGALPPARALEVARQVALGLHAAHEAGIVHRDLKPGNIMLYRQRDGTELVKVVDFDIAKGPEAAAGEEVTRHGFVVGTPEYMSPEQLMGERLDGRSDIYALGIVVFRMLTGAQPFRSESTQDLMIARLTTAPLSLAEVLPGAALPPAVQAALNRSLQRRPQDRHATAAEFAEEMQAAVAALGGQSGTLAGAAPSAALPASQPGAQQPGTAAPARPTTADVVPETRLAPAVGTDARPPAGRMKLIAIAVAAVLVLAAGTSVGIRLMTSRAEPPAGTAAGADAAAPEQQAAASSVGDAAAVAAAPTPSAAQPEAAAPVPPPVAAPAPARAVWTAEHAQLLLGRQTRTLVLRSGDLHGARDTLALLWERRAVLPQERHPAIAAGLGEYHLLQGNWRDCAAWYGRAWDLNQATAYEAKRGQCEERRDGGGGT